MAGNFTLEGKNGDIALKMLKDVTDLLDQHSIPYWLEGGTLLGVIRENRLLPWDNDLDISIKNSHLDRLQQALKELNWRYRVRVREFEKNEPPFQKSAIRLIKIKNRKLLFFSGEVSLDIFIKFEKDNETFWQIGDKRKSVPSRFYDELLKYEFDGKEYLVPKLYREYLTFRYGDWQTVVKEWNTFKDDKALQGDKQ